MYSLNAARLIFLGWSLILLVAALMVIATTDKMGEAIVFAAIALANLVWVRARRSRPAAVTSLVLGTLLTLMHSGYVIAGATAGSFRPTDIIVLADLAAVTGGVLLVLGSIKALTERRRHAAEESGATA